MTISVRNMKCLVSCLVTCLKLQLLDLEASLLRLSYLQGYKILILMSHLELEPGPRFAETWLPSHEINKGRLNEGSFGSYFHTQGKFCLNGL